MIRQYKMKWEKMMQQEELKNKGENIKVD